MTIKILLLDLSRGLKPFFSGIFRLNVLVPIGKEEDAWYHSPCWMGGTLCIELLCKSC